MTQQENQGKWAVDTDFYEIPVSLLDISNRSLNVFRKYGIKSVGDLMEHDQADLRDMRGFGDGCLKETMEALAAEGVNLKPIDYSARR